MNFRSAVFLRAFAVWTMFVWLTRIRNVFDQGRSTGFVVVHLVLAVVSVAFALGTFVIVRTERGKS